MRRLPLLVLLLLPLPALAQFGVSSIDDPIRPDRAPLAAAEEVPDVLLLGMEGTSPLFVNPARAARARSRFVYGTIRQPGQTGAPVSFSGLFGTRDRRWLVTADNSIVTRDDTERLTATRTQPGPGGGTVAFESERVRENLQTLSNTRARLLLVGRTDFGGYAVGLNGGYRGADATASQTSRLSQSQTNDEFNAERVDEQADVRRLRSDDFAVGVEAAFAGETWDLVAATSYQRRTADATFNSSSGYFRSITIPENHEVIRDEQSRIHTRAIEGAPEAVDFEVIGALRAGRKRDDYLYGSVRGTFGGGTVDYGSIFSDESLLIRTVGGEVVQREEMRTGRDDAGTVDLDVRDTFVSLGYVYARRGRDVTVLAALNPTAAFGRVESVPMTSSGTVFASEQTDERTEIALTLPLYVRFDVTRRLEAFGGGVYSYAYERVESAQRPLYPADLLGDDRTLEIVHERTSETFSSSGRLFAGAVMTFRSGLTAQAAFRGDLAQFSAWTVSLGYRF